MFIIEDKLVSIVYIKLCISSWSSGGGNLETGSYPPTPQGFYNPQSPDASMGRDTPSVHSATSETVGNSRQVDDRSTYIIL